MNRSTNRLRATATGLAVCAVVLTGCGAGQISQTASQVAAVNGNSAGVKNLELRNVHLQVVQTGDFLQPGSAVPLMFVAANESPEVTDRLVRITSEVGSVAVTGDGTIPAGGALVVGSPDGQDAVMPMGDAKLTTAEVTLTKPITNGLTYNFTFEFEKAGSTTVAVPLSAGESPARA